MKHPNTFIFDLDGTLIDTIGDLTAALNHGLSLFGFGTKTVSEVKDAIGNGMRILVKRCCPNGTDENTLAAVNKAFGTYYMAHLDDFSRPYDGMQDLVQRLGAEGYKTAVLTNKDHFAAETIIHKYFGCDMLTLGVTDFEFRKPNPASAFRLLEKLGSRACDAVMIGDSPTDMLTAENAAMRSVAVLWGYRKKEQLLPYKPDAFCASQSELYGVLTNL